MSSKEKGLFSIVKKVENPKFLVITPLKIEDKISKKTLNSIEKNSTPFDWVSFNGKWNIPTNTKYALENYNKKFEKLPYIVKIDNDINAAPCLLDFMYQTIKESNDNIAYVYSSFVYTKKDKIQYEFKAIPFSWKKLLNHNYISSNSMIKQDLLEKIGGFVCNKKFERLLDWALWLKFFENGYLGLPSQGFFAAEMNENSVSSRGIKDYKKKHEAVSQAFVKPILEKMQIATFEKIDNLGGIIND